MKIGIISDTHGIFREDWKPYLKECDYLLHAGDFVSERCYEEFLNLGIPFYAVRGNCDHGEFAQYLHTFLQVPIGGKMFYLVHNQADFPFDKTDADYLVFGHTHRYEIRERFDKVYLNPGSAGEDRGTGKTMMILELTETGYEIRQILL